MSKPFHKQTQSILSYFRNLFIYTSWFKAKAQLPSPGLNTPTAYNKNKNKIFFYPGRHIFPEMMSLSIWHLNYETKYF